ncbi:hypothetical protein [Marinococcus sp. PL1-022]|uniref:hypothetical protein n=1 Tax=Marinococcus sp. PL1-022 TaxID=3095363 RepID=UPI0029C2ED79|nr:hypothetical protein [Marinococcus sp. PL1-022]MDX6153157.1 hypothetical protein [Marinococcus sp. PL1-022]
MSSVYLFITIVSLFVMGIILFIKHARFVMRMKNYILGPIVEYNTMFFEGLRLFAYTMFGNSVLEKPKT